MDTSARSATNRPVLAIHGRWRRALTRVAIGMGLVVSLGIIGAVIAVFAVPFPIEVLASRPDLSTRVVDSHGATLHEIPSPNGTRARWVDLAAISPHVRNAFMAAEDQRFEDHAGIDGIAMLRAAAQRVFGSSVAGGASTITQQLVKRLLMAGRPRNISTKIEEIVLAMRLEHAVDKSRILEEYLNRIDFGNRLVGIETAALGYFGLSASNLAPSQAALLAALPNAPHDLNPRRHPERAIARAHHILRRMTALGLLSETDLRTALAEPLQLEPLAPPFLAPWLTTRLVANLAENADRPAIITTTLDLRLQQMAETVVANPQQPLQDGMPAARGGRHQAAIVILSTQTAEVLAWAGSRDWRDADALGRTDAVTALRQPGSALKPFIYAMLFETGQTPDDIVEDVPTTFETAGGPYRPQNFDRRFRGEVTIREALGSSLNIPAVKAITTLGVPTVLERLRRLGLTSLAEHPDHYGPGLALGNGEVRLVDLANAYATLGRLGNHIPWQWRPNTNRTAPTAPVIDRNAALAILEILTDDRARGIGFGHASALNLPFRVALKTGTSSDRRDNLAVGVTPEYTVAVWVGNFDGRPMNTADPHLAAAPIIRAVFQRLYPRAARPGDVRWFERPAAQPPHDRRPSRNP